MLANSVTILSGNLCLNQYCTNTFLNTGTTVSIMVPNFLYASLYYSAG